MTEPEPVDPPFISLHELRAAGVSIGALATAVERLGVLGWDRYGRFQWCLKDSPDVRGVLDALARAHEATWQYRPDEDLRPDADPLGNPWHEFGWPKDKCPDFGAIASGLVERPARGGTVRGDNAMTNLAAAMFALIRGDLPGCAKHPDYVNNDELQDLLEKKAGGSGLGRTAVLEKFAKFRKVLGFPD